MLSFPEDSVSVGREGLVSFDVGAGWNLELMAVVAVDDLTVYADNGAPSSGEFVVEAGVAVEVEFSWFAEVLNPSAWGTGVLADSDKLVLLDFTDLLIDALVKVSNVLSELAAQHTDLSLHAAVQLVELAVDVGLAVVDGKVGRWDHLPVSDDLLDLEEELSVE